MFTTKPHLLYQHTLFNLYPDDHGRRVSHDGATRLQVMVMRFVRHYRGPTKLLVRAAGLATIALLSFCGIVYLTWSLPGLSSRTTLTSFLPKTTAKEVKIRWNDAPRRVIVFGDSWSDNGHYPVDPPGQGQSSTRDAAQGKVWTEWLCAAVRGDFT